MDQVDSIETLKKHIEDTEELYNILWDNVIPNLNRKRKEKANRESLRQVLVTYLVRVAKDYAEKQGTPNEWKKMFPSQVREATASMLLEHHKHKLFLFAERKIFEPKEPEPEPVPDPLEQLGDINKLVKRALNVIGDAETKEEFYQVLSKLSKAELKLICENLGLKVSDEREKLELEIVKDFYGDY